MRRAAGLGRRGAVRRAGPAPLPRLHSGRGSPWPGDRRLLPSREGRQSSDSVGPRELAGGRPGSAFICSLDFDSFLENFLLLFPGTEQGGAE